VPIPPARSPAIIVAVVCVAEILGMTPFSMFLALQPILQAEWQLSNTMSGWISSAYYAGYMIAVPVLASLTDRFDARTVWLTAITFAAGAAIGFSTIATHPVTAVLCQALAGAGLAGTYMPGLKLMGDRIATALHPRQVAFYTTSFSLGASGSYFLVGQLVQDLPWRTAIAVAACGPLIAWALIYFTLERVAPTHPDIDVDISSARWSRCIAISRHDALRRGVRLPHVGVVRNARVARPLPRVLRNAQWSNVCGADNPCRDTGAGRHPVEFRRR
jgi:MFS family permease